MIQIVNVKNGPKCKYLYIGRENKYYKLPQSKWANPFVIGRDGDRAEVIDKYHNWIILERPDLLEDLHELDGNILGCWCNFPSEDCHGRVLIELRKNQLKNKGSKTIICGSRSITDKDLIWSAINESPFTISEVVCGLAKGPDTEGKNWAIYNNVKVIEFPANWTDFTEIPCKIKIDKNGRKYNCLAGVNRNKRMVDYICPDGKVIAIHNFSSGTLSTIKMARDKGLEVFEKVVNV